MRTAFIALAIADALLWPIAIYFFIRWRISERRSALWVTRAKEKLSEMDQAKVQFLHAFHRK